MKVLIVEDEMIISEDIRMMLEDHDYIITDQSVSYAEAIKSLASDPPDMVLLDINLKGNKSGIDVANIINQNKRIPFIYTSSLGDSQTIDQAKKTKPSAYLIKPFKEAQLMAAIEIAMINFTAPKAEDKTSSDNLAMFNESIFIKEGHKFTKIVISDIQYIQKSDNYIDIFTNKSKHTIRSTMNDFLERLSFDRIFRTHKSYAINLDYVTRLTPTSIFVEQSEIPLAKSYLNELKSKLRIF